MVAAPHPAAAQAWRFHAPAVLGTSLEVVAVTPSRAEALVAAQAARAEIARLDAVLSGWREDSELCALNRARTLAVSSDLYAVLAACERWRALTGDAFDHRLGAAFALQRRAAADGRAPHHETLAALVSAGRSGTVRLDPATRTASLDDGVTVAPEALAKGYVVDRALAAARAAAPGLQGLMIDIGGDLRTWGRGPEGGWTVGVAEAGVFEANAAPTALLRADGLAVATSGRRSPGDGHILGRAGVTGATVVGASAADADALATALCAMPAEAGLALAEALPGMEARTLADDGTVRTTGGWDAFVLASPEPPARLWRVADAAPDAAAAPVPWPRRFALTIGVELPYKGERTYSPYVAVWITDEEGRLVRAIAMYGEKLDYVNENYVWWRRYGRSRPQIVAAITRPTQPPGRHTLVWDGRDDMGRPVGQGHYTLNVEATREDGFHTYQAVELNLAADPSVAMSEAQDELGVTVARYGPR